MCIQPRRPTGLIKSSTRAVRGALDAVVGSLAEFNKCAAAAADAPACRPAPEPRSWCRGGSFTLEEVARHACEDDAWLVVKNRVRAPAGGLIGFVSDRALAARRLRQRIERPGCPPRRRGVARALPGADRAGAPRGRCTT